VTEGRVRLGWEFCLLLFPFPSGAGWMGRPKEESDSWWRWLMWLGLLSWVWEVVVVVEAVRAVAAPR
jgi:hypothetical protein